MAKIVLPALSWMETLAEAVGDEIRPLFGQTEVIEIKEGGKDIHTRADFLAEEFILKKIRKYPDIAVFSEETVEKTGGRFPEAEFIWVIDPLDGTTNFRQGNNPWAVSIALCQRREPIRGVVYIPGYNPPMMFSAEKGKGAYLNGRQIRVSGKTELSEAVVAMDIPNLEPGQSNAKEVFSLLNPKVRAIRMLGSAASALAKVGAGNFDVYFHLGLKPYDVAAASLVIQEAGGTVTRVSEGRWDILCKDALAGTPDIHGQIFKILQNYHK